MSKKSRTSARSISPFVLAIGVVIALVIAGSYFLFGRNNPAPPADDATAAPPPSVTTAPLTAAPPADAPVTNLARANVAQGEWYTLYFTKPTYPEKAADRNGGVDAAIVADIEHAQKTIDAAVFDFRLPALVDAFARAAQRGVRVRLVTDYAANQVSKEYTGAIEKMEKAGVQVLRDHRSALMHNKFVVIDNRLLWTGSMNFTANDVYRNNNNMLRVMMPQLIENYNARFERLFQMRDANAPGKQVPNPKITLSSGVTIENYFSPTGGTQKAILDKLKAAKKNIRVTAFTFTDTAMGDVLKAQAKANLAVQGVFEARNNGAQGAEYEDLKRAGLDVLEDGNCYILHSKTMVIDNRFVVTGSYNFTANAEKSNDENILIIDDPKLAKEYLTEFNRLYKQAQAPTKCGDAKTLDTDIETEQ
jgi:phosphatidylserine/phosphatidylglycerophosphate/cardiolipin synthase-like enzyme